MTEVYTAHGRGEIVETSTSRGRTQYRVAGRGFDVWLDETKVQKVAGEEPSDLFSYGPVNHLRNKAIAHIPGSGPDDAEDTRKFVGSDMFPAEPASHVNEDNTTDLPYDPTPQYPVELFGDESTISPDHEIDEEERTSPSKSLSGESGKEREYPGPNPDLFAKSAGRDDDWWSYADEIADDPQALADERERLYDEDDHPEFFDRADYIDELLQSHGSEAFWNAADPSNDQHLSLEERNLDAPLPGEHHAGLSSKYIQIEAEVDHYNDPVQKFRDDPVGQIQRLGYLDISAGLDRETGEWMDLVEADKSIRTAAWRDVRQKALRLRREGAVEVEDLSYDRIYAKVKGDHGVYDVMIAKGGDYGQVGNQAISNWRCACKWGQWAFKRQLTYVGRLCSHGYAAYLTMQSDHNKDRGPGGRFKRKSSVVDDFTKWVEERNNGHQDFDAVEGYLSLQPLPLPRDDAEKLYDYVAKNPAERPERNYDVDEYTYDYDKVYKEGELLRRTPLSLKPDMFFVPEGEEEHFVDVEKDERKTTGPGQIQARRLARLVMAELQKRWHKDQAKKADDHDPIVKFSERRAALVYTADEDLLNKLRDLSAEAPGENNQNMRDHVEEVADVVDELHDRGYAASPLVASIMRVADGPSNFVHDDSDQRGPNIWNSLGGATEPTSGGGASAANSVHDDSAQRGKGLFEKGGPLNPAVHYDPSKGVDVPDAPAGLPTPGAGQPAQGGGAGAQAERRGLPAAPTAPTSGPNAPLLNSGAGGSYDVVKGDTMSGIAQSKGVDLNALEKANPGITNPNLIFPGEKIQMPGSGANGSGKSSWGSGSGSSTSSPWASAPLAGGLSGNNGGGGIPQPPKPPTPPGGSSSSKAWGLKAQRLSWYRTADWTNGAPSSDDNKGKDYKPLTTPPATGPAAGPAQPPASKPGSGNLPQGDNGAASSSAKPDAPLAAEQGGSADPSKSQAQSGGGSQGAPGINMGQIGSMIGQVGGALGGMLPGGLGSLVTGLSGLAPMLLHSGREYSWYKDASYGVGNQGGQPGGAFLQPGGPSWADASFSGSGPDPKMWATTSADYVDEHERDRHEAVDDGDGDIASYTKKQPKQSRRYLAEVDSQQGVYNPRLHLTQEYDKGSTGLGGDKKGKGKGKPANPEKSPDDVAEGDAATAAGGGEIGGIAEEFPALAEAGFAFGASREADDDSDIVRQFQASGGGALNAPAGNGGSFSDDAIAKQAQRMLRTAGRVYSLAEQRELEQEEHHLGARNLDGLDLEGTHYL